MKRIVSIIIAILMLTTVISFISIPTTKAFSGSGSGTAEDPYQITNADELNQTGDDLDAYYILMNDIDLNDYGVQNWNDGEGFDSIGGGGSSFSGSFDGQNYTISNLYMNRPSTIRQAFFYILSGPTLGTIKNLRLTFVDITGGENTGGLVSESDMGTITNCYVSGTVVNDGSSDYIGLLGGTLSEGSVTDCHTAGTVTGTNYVGGLFGHSSSGSDAITNCYSTADITGNYYTGGVLGFNYGSVTNCYSTGTITGVRYTGGIAGYTPIGTISNCHATGTISGTDFYIGGITGFINSGTITNCYSSADVTQTVSSWPTDSAAGIAGCIGTTATVTNCYSTGTITSNANGVGGIVGWNYGDVTYCYSTANIIGTGGDSTYFFGGIAGTLQNSGASVVDCYSAGSVTSSGANVGGLIGYTSSGTTTNSYWDTETSGQLTSSAGTGRTTAEMIYDYDGYDPPEAGLYEDWDLADYDGSSSIWVHDPVSQTHGYPSLRWQYSTESGVYNGYPFNESTNIPLQPVCRVGVVSSVSTMDIIWQENSTGDWITRQVDDDVSNGTYTWTYSQAIEESHAYYWRVFMDDGVVNLSAWYSFTTGIITISNEDPANGSLHIPLQPVCSIDVTSPGDTMNITWQENSTGSWVTRQVNNSVGDGTYTWTFSQATTRNRLYYWRVFVDDGTVNMIAWYRFTTYLPFTGGGTGVIGDPYKITNCDELNQTGLFLDAHFILMNDIDLNDYDVQNWNGGEGFATIGDYENLFVGSFNGQSHIISNLYINRPSESYLGLFAATGTDSIVKNLILLDINITGDTVLAGIVGDSYGDISDCYTTGTIIASQYAAGITAYVESDATISNCHSSVDTISTVGHNGGIFGDNTGTVINCYATGNHTSYTSGYGSGGLGGWNYYGTITNCHSSGTVTGPTSGSSNSGGLVGINYGGTITASYATGDTIGANRIGGLVGTTISGAGGTITNCYATGDATGAQYVGGLIGRSYGTVTKCYSTGAVSGSSSYGGLIGARLAGSVTYSYWDTETSGQPSSAAGTGRTTAQMTYPYEGYDPPETGLYEGWDLAEYTPEGSSIWVHDDPQNDGYPLFRGDYEPLQSPTDTIIVTFEPGGTISILVNQSSWSPSAKLGETEATATNWVKLENNGDVQVDVKVNASDSSAWTLTTGSAHNQFQLQYGVGLESEQYIHAGGPTYGVFQYWDNMTKKAEGAYDYEIKSIVEDATYVYAGGGDYTVYQCWKSNMTLKAETLPEDTNYYIINSLAEDIDYVYAGCQYGYICQWWKSNMTLKSVSVTIASYDISAITDDDTYLYCADAGGESSTIYQLWKSNLTERQSVDDYDGDINAVAQDTNYVYVAGDTIWEVYQYYKSNMTKKAETPIYTGEIWTIAVDDTYLYAGGYNESDVYNGEVCKYLKSTMEFVDKTTGFDTITSLAQDTAYIYATGYNNQRVYQFLKSDMSLNANTTDYGAGLYAVSTYEPTSDVSWTDLTIVPLPFISNFAYDESQDFGLKIFMPTSSSTNTVQTVIITFSATVD